MLTTQTLYRVMVTSDDGYGNESFVKFGPLRKSLQAALRAAEQRRGYVVDCSTGQTIYTCPQALEHKPKVWEKRDWGRFNQAQMFPSLALP